LLGALTGEDRRAALVRGQRQVGKTTLLWQCADRLLDERWPARNVTYCDLSDERVHDPGEVLRALDEEPPSGADPSVPRVLLVDEVGRAPRWADWLKRMVDTRRHRIIVTDSSAQLLRRGSRESGQGRWDEPLVEGLTFEEFITLRFDTDSVRDHLAASPDPVELYLAAGAYPEHVRSDDVATVRRRIRADIVDRALYRDLERLESVVDVSRVADLFAYLVEDSGAIFGAVKRARDFPNPPDQRSLRRWLNVLCDTLLVYRLPAFAKSATARARRQARIHAADAALVVAFAPVAQATLQEAVRGRAFEAAVFRHLREQTAHRPNAVHYFRDAKDDGLEIDFVVSDQKRHVAVEVTASRSPRPEKVTRLLRAAQRVGAQRALLVHGGVSLSRDRQVDLVPLGEFMLDSARWLEGSS